MTAKLIWESFRFKQIDFSVERDFEMKTSKCHLEFPIFLSGCK